MLEINVSPLWQAVVCDVVGRLVASVEPAFPDSIFSVEK
jgi:hypothetical protein